MEVELPNLNLFMIETAIKAVKEAAEITSVHFGKLKDISEKIKDREIVTDIDIKAENKIKEIIKSKFPSHGFLGEELGKEESNSEYLWMTDSIDGTVNYSRGLKKYGISLALAKGKNVILGVVYNPITDELFTAEKGKGAFLNGEPVKVNQNKDIFQAVIYATEFYRSKDI